MGYRNSMFAGAILAIFILGSFSGYNPDTTDVHTDDSPAEAEPDVFGDGGTRAGPEWPTFGGDNHHTGATTGAGPTANTVKWKANCENTNDATYSTPTVADGKVFIGTFSGRVIAYNATTGSVIFNVSLGSGGYGVSSTPAYANGHIVVYNNGNDAIYRLNATTGATNWSYDTGSASYGGSSPVITNGTVWVGSSTKTFYCLDEISGSVRWSYTTGNGITRSYGVCSSPAVDNTHVYVGACDGYLYCFNRDSPSNPSPSYVWRTSLSDCIFAGPTLQGQYVYCGEGSYNQNEGSVDSYTMHQMWKSNGTIRKSITVGNHIMSTPAFYNGTIYFGSLDNWFYAVHTSNMSVKWKYQTGGDLDNAPAIADGKVYFTSEDTDIYCRNADTGAAIWNYNMPNEAWSGVSIWNGMAYTACTGTSDNVFCFGTADTTPPQVTANTPLNSAVDVSTTSVLTATFDEAMNPSTISTGTFTVVDSLSAGVTGVVTYSAATKTATFTPSSTLQMSETYTATLSTGMKDMSGNRLDGDKDGNDEGSPTDDHSWSFTTTSNSAPELSGNLVAPTTAPIDTTFYYQVVYTDADDDPPSGSGFIRVHIDNDTGHNMTLNNSAPASLNDGDYTNGEAFQYATTLGSSGPHSFFFNASDGIDLNATPMQYSPRIPNVPPTFQTIPDKAAVEDVEKEFDLSQYIDDPDTAQVDLVLTSTDNTDHVEGISGLNVTVLYPEGVLSEDIELDLYDGLSHRQRTLHLDVTPVNDAPLISGVPDQDAVAEEDLILNVKSYVSDVDNEKSELSISTNSDHATVDGFVITFNYPRDTGSEVVTLTVDDGLAEGEQDITVDVETPDLNIPAVSLSRPADAGTISVDEVELAWSLSYGGTETVKYDVLLGTSASLTTANDLVSGGKSALTFAASGLQDGTTYHWTVIPTAGAFTGNCTDGTFSFTVDLSTPSSYGVNVTLSRYAMTGKPGATKEVTATMVNEGSVSDILIPDVASVDLPSVSVQSQGEELILASGEGRDLTVTMVIPSDAVNGTTYAVDVTGASKGSGLAIVDTERLEVTVVVDTPDVPDGTNVTNGTDGEDIVNGTDGGDGGTGEDGEDGGTGEDGTDGTSTDGGDGGDGTDGTDGTGDGVDTDGTSGAQGEEDEGKEGLGDTTSLIAVVLVIIVVVALLAIIAARRKPAPGDESREVAEPPQPTPLATEAAIHEDSAPSDGEGHVGDEGEEVPGGTDGDPAPGALPADEAPALPPAAEAGEPIAVPAEGSDPPMAAPVEGDDVSMAAPAAAPVAESAHGEPAEGDIPMATPLETPRD